jgi:transposase
MKQPLREETKIAAALLRSKGYPELEIAHMLGISQSSVPKCLNWARKQQYLIVPPPEFVEARVSPDVLAKVRAIVSMTS